MKCNQCGTEFEGKFCPECGTKNEVETPVTPTPIQRQQVYQESAPTATKPKKKKKPFYLRWWFIILAIIVIGVIALSADKKIIWDDIILGDMLPEPPATKGEIHTNSADKLWIDINNLSDKQFNNYIVACKEKGFTVDAESYSSSYDAYNAEGYELSLSYHGKDMKIRLEAPMEMTTIAWPTGAAGKQLPTPKSTTGKFSYERNDEFFVYVGNTSKADYAEYVNACSEKGFNIDYDKGDDYYYADNSEGWEVSVCYVGNNIMSIEIDAPITPLSTESEEETSKPTESSETTESEEETSKSTESSKTTENEEETESSKTTESTSNSTDSNLVNGMHKDFKESMDSYEEFMDEYVAFMKKYNANPSDLELLADYATFMSKYTDVVSKFDKWESEDLNDTELAYYIDVQTRVTKKLLEVAN